MLSDGADLVHEFRFANETGRTMVPRGKWLSSPCCSAIGRVPERVAPGEVLAIPVALRTRDTSGPVRGEFLIRTNGPELQTLRMELSATVLRRVEPRQVLERPSVVKGRNSRAHSQLVLRGSSGESIVWPNIAGLLAKYDGEAKLEPSPGGIFTAVRDLTVEITGDGEPGPRIRELVLRWPNGGEVAQSISWAVVPAIRPSPRTIPLKRGKEAITQMVTIRSEDGPLRVLEVLGAGVDGFEVLPQERDVAERVLKLSLNPAKWSGPLSIVRIRTDHPRCEEVELNIIATGAFRRDHLRD